MKINRDSWHYKMMAFFLVLRNYITNGDIYYDLKDGLSFVEAMEKNLIVPRDLCSYIRTAFIIPFWSLSLNLLLVFLILTMLASDPVQSITIILGVVLILATFVSILFVMHGIGKGVEKIAKAADDGETFVGSVYNSYKNNVCTMIEIEKRDQ